MNKKFAVSMLAASILLTACGGGGGGSDKSTTRAPTPADLQTSVPSSTYGVSSVEQGFFAALNDFRSKLGLGLLAQNTKLDLASQNHLAYVTTHSTLNGGSVDMAAIDPTYNVPRFHIEESAKAGFTGVQAKDRAAAAGYSGAYVGEVGAYGQGAGSVGALNGLINTVFHRLSLMNQGIRDVGIAAAADAAETVVVKMAYASTPQRNASDYVGFYPGANQTGVPLFAGVESPNPFSDISYADYATKTSAPINLVSAEGTTLAVTSFTVTENGQSTPLDARLLVKSTDANTNMYFGPNVAFLVAKTAFKPSTVYNVAFSGTIDGKATSKTWSFTTGS